MDFGKIASLAKSAVAGDKPEGEQQQQQPQSAEQKWSDVGATAKKAAEDFQKDRAEGRGPNYQEIGQVAQKAFSAYQSEGGDEGKADLTKIGRSIADGLAGGSKQAVEPPQQQQEPAPATTESAPAPALAAAPEQQQNEGDLKSETAPVPEPERKEVSSPVPDAVTKKAAEQFGVSEGQVNSFMSAGLKAFGSN